MLGNALARQFRFTRFALDKNLEGMTHQESLQAPPGGGSRLNWIVGHIVHTRNHVLRLLGEQPIWEDGRGGVYARGSRLDDPNEAIALDSLREDLDRSQEMIVAALAERADDDFHVKLPEPSELMGDTVGTALTTLAFHEAYHVGQTGVLRRVLGRSAAIP